RVFNVTIDGATVLSNYDIVADVGALKGVVKSFPVTTTAANPNITITFGHVTQNPLVKGIEIDQVGSRPNQLSFPTTAIDFGSVANGQPTSTTLSLTNLGAPGDPVITLTGLNVSGPDAHQ